jgi:hypothetical protein
MQLTPFASFLELRPGRICVYVSSQGMVLKKKKMYVDVCVDREWHFTFI